MALTAICAKINAPIFSIKHPETFQIAASLPIPQPSSLVGALAYCIGTEQGIGLRAQEIVEEIVAAARGKLVSEVAITNPVILRRFRILDKGIEEGDFKKSCEALHLGDFDTFRNILEKKLTDALYREYISPAILKCIWILRTALESKVLYLLQRLGDTESLVSVTEAWSTSCEILSVDEVTTDYPFTLDDSAIDTIQGDYTVLKMCDEKRRLKLFYVPCKKEVRSTPTGVKYFTYIPTKINVKFKKPRTVFVADGDYIL
ncbi:MAG: type I-A CRISPR-associated protein Cas5a [Desulfurococcaceae archaeon]